jgi:hypothetical protein
MNSTSKLTFKIKRVDPEYPWLNPEVVYALSSRENVTEALDVRMDALEAGVDSAVKNPLVGSGYVRLKGEKIYFEHSHNTFLQMMIERGVFALVALLWIAYILLKNIGKYTGAIFSMACGMIGLLVFGLSDYVFYVPGVAIMFFTYLAWFEKADDAM